jgi:outer membrane lipoprotein carrier protein
MKSIFLAVLKTLFTTAVFTMAQTVLAATPLDDFLQRLQSVTSIDAQFEQSTVDAQGQEMQTITGQLIVARPGKMRWQTQPPYEQLVVSDGELVWIYDMDLEQVTIRNLDQRLQETPALLLSGNLAEIAQNYSVERFDVDKLERYRLTPNDKSQLFIALEFDYKANTLQNMRIYDAAGQITLIKFSKQRINEKLDAMTFVFDVPEGVDVIDGRHGF